MERFAQSSVEDRRAGFVQTGEARKLSPIILEKDFWVCWTLKQMFGLPAIGERLIFKGGTSLSKVFRLIDRFSEDIDISIDRIFLGFGGSNEPEAGNSNKEKQRRIAALKVACQQKISDELLPALRAVIQSKVSPDDRWSLYADDDDPDQQTLLFEYPTSFPPDTTGYISRAVKIEMGARADHWPCETRPVTPYVAEQFPQGFHEPSCTVKVLSAERTFWEKATILHAEFHRPAEKPMPDRLSRHYSDFAVLIGRGVAEEAMAHLELLARVSQHKNLFFKSSWANYGTAMRGTLRIVPPDHRMQALRGDYAKMEQMFFSQPIEFDEMISALAEWEAQFNQQ